MRQNTMLVQQHLYYSIMGLLSTRGTKSVERRCTIIRFPSEKVPAALIPYLGLDDTRNEAIQAVIDQARTDANMANSKCAYADTDPEAALICELFESMPEPTDPSKRGNGATGDRHANA